MNISVDQIHMPRAESGVSQAYGGPMPVQRCTFEGKPAWRYGGSGKPYTFNADDPESEKRAKQKAIDQGLAMTKGTLDDLNKDIFGSEGPNDLDIAHTRLIDEAQGAASYQSAADRATDPDLKKLLQKLASDELGHTKELTDYIESHRPKPSEAQKSVAEKSAAGPVKRIVVPIAKVIGDVVYGVVVHANKVDLQGDIMSPADIRKAMHQFMAESRKINKDHSEDIDACPVECWQATEKGFLGSSEYAPGDWLMGTKILDPNELAKARAGDYRSYSIEGFGVRVPTDS